MIYLTHHFAAIELATLRHQRFIANTDDTDTRHMATIEDAVATASACKDFWTALDAVFNESRTIATIRDRMIEEANGRHAVFLMQFGNAASQLDKAIDTVSKRVRQTLTSPDRPLLTDELNEAMNVVAKIGVAQSELLAAQVLFAAMQSPEGLPPLSIAYQ